MLQGTGGPTCPAAERRQVQLSIQILMSRVVIGQSVDPLDHCSLQSFQSGHQ